MTSAAAIFSIFHDAIVVAISGRVSGSLRLVLDCDYLRDRLEDPGDRFFLTLDECTRFRYRRSADDGDLIDDPTEIAARRLWISGSDQHEGFCVVHCSEHMQNGSSGTLEIAARALTVTIESGREIGWSELEEIAEEYWSGFHSQNQK